MCTVEFLVLLVFGNTAALVLENIVEQGQLYIVAEELKCNPVWEHSHILLLVFALVPISYKRSVKFVLFFSKLGSLYEITIAINLKSFSNQA